MEGKKLTMALDQGFATGGFGVGLTKKSPAVTSAATV
jgi:hypothetical protein